MNFLREHKNIIIGVILVIVGFVLYTFLTKSADDEGALIVVSEDVSGTDALAGTVGYDLLVLLAELPRLKLDGEIFESDIFKGLIDFGQELTKQPVGRPNPFAPIGIGAGFGVIPGGEDEESDDSEADAGGDDVGPNGMEEGDALP